MLFAVSTIPMAMLTACAYERAGIVASIAVHTPPPSPTGDGPGVR
ncbi:hypothetical protein SMALA_3734 [Streptomyces malaysiensis subsp. malaysiensis]|nr:hypothetical protein SMALA_3734 [Streptomyces malaysiensis]